jgi:hypothetical protein
MQVTASDAIDGVRLKPRPSRQVEAASESLLLTIEILQQ